MPNGCIGRNGIGLVFAALRDPATTLAIRTDCGACIDAQSPVLLIWAQFPAVGLCDSAMAGVSGRRRAKQQRK